MLFILAQTETLTTPDSSPGWLMAKFFLATLLIILLAWVVIRFLLPRFYGIRKSQSKFKILERFPLEPRKTLYLIQVGKKNIVLGTSEHGMNKIDEIREEDL